MTVRLTLLQNTHSIEAMSLTLSGVGAIICMIIYLTIAFGLAALQIFHPKWRPKQGSNSGANYASRCRLGIVLLVHSAAVLAVVIGLAVDRWTVGPNYIYGLIHVSSFGQSFTYSDFCGLIDASQHDMCNLVLLASGLTFAAELAGLVLNISVLVHALVLWFRPVYMPQFVARQWWASVFGNHFLFIGACTWGLVGLPASTSISGGDVGLSETAASVANFLNFLMCFFHWYAVKATAVAANQVELEHPLAEAV